MQWLLVDHLLLRGSYAISFRAPDMHSRLGQPSSAQVRTLDHSRCIARRTQPLFGIAVFGIGMHHL
nr:hypothetical protein [Xanthomonas arboricola]